MKIGYLLQQEENVFTPPYNGPANHVRELTRAFNQIGHEVKLLTQWNGRILTADDLDNPRPVTVPALDRGPLRLLERIVRRTQYELKLPYAALFESVRFALACRQELSDCDVLLERMSWVSYGGALAARWLKMPLVLENNGDHLLDLEAKGIAPRGLQAVISCNAMGWATRQAAHIAVSGDGWRDQFLERWRTPADTVTTIENGTVLIRLLQRSELYAFQETEASPFPVALVYLGGFTPWQGVPILLQALALASAVEDNLQLILIGAGEGKEEAEQLATRLNLQQQAIFTGHLSPEEYAPILARADIGVAPYCNWPEFSGLKIFDYKAAGLPVIVSGKNGRPRTVSHEKTGLIVPPCDVDALVEAINQLAANHSLRRQMGQAARLEAETCHEWRHTAETLTTVFDQAIR